MARRGEVMRGGEVKLSVCDFTYVAISIVFNDRHFVKSALTAWQIVSTKEMPRATGM